MSSIITYNGSTIVHFLLGGVGIVLSYGNSTRVGYTLGLLYVLLAFSEMYVVMPLAVCPSCVYRRMKGALCIAGLNVLSARVAKERAKKDFPKRAEGLFCANNLYMASLIVPIAAMIPGMIFNFSGLLLLVFLVVAGLLIFRFFIIFPKLACLHCKAKYACPQAGAMGVRDK
ncbi:MAG TPA: hypothetical protein VLW86_00570 [Syntrophorhabdales bacterium]|nr:hypothetical protein [Syntrophorhabdales bacterium]